MILEFCWHHRDAITPELDRSALLDAQALVEEQNAPLGVTGAELLAVAWSSLAFRIRSQGGVRELGELDGEPLPRLEAIREPSPAEYARLIGKGRLLYEHCMAEISHHCVMGFMDHELTKSRDAERVILELLGWMVEQRIELEPQGDGDAEEVSARVAHTDYMIDLGVGLLHGLSRKQAQDLALAREP